MQSLAKYNPWFFLRGIKSEWGQFWSQTDKKQSVTLPIYKTLSSDNEEYPVVKLLQKLHLLDTKEKGLGLVGMSMEIPTDYSDDEIPSYLYQQKISLGSSHYFQETQLPNARRKEAEKTLLAAKEAAEESQRLKNEFIQNMEHDIRTPFSGILGMAKILNEIETDPNKKQMISEIASCAEELLDYSCNIVEFSKIQAGGFPVFSKKFELSKILESIMAIESPAAKIKNLNLILKKDKRIPAALIGDAFRLKRVLLDLLGNAIKFTETGTVSLKIEYLKKLNERDIVLQFIVEDTGIGIPKEKLKIVYDKFSRLTPSNQGLYKGQGLGLMLVKKFIEEMNGEIEIKSTLNKGTRCICTIPFRESLTA